MIIAWQDYNQQLAEQNKLTAHGKPDGAGQFRNTFFRNNDFLEAEAATISLLHTPFVVCGRIDGRPVAKVPALRKKIQTTMYFLGYVGGSGVALTDTLEQVQQQTYDLMMQFIARYLEDHQVSGACGPFAKLDAERMIFQQAGPFLQAHYGWQLRMDFVEDAPEFLFDSSKWTS